jgi:outer membrane biosynthesis protein TonB
MVAVIGLAAVGLPLLGVVVWWGTSQQSTPQVEVEVPVAVIEAPPVQPAVEAVPEPPDELPVEPVVTPPVEVPVRVRPPQPTEPVEPVEPVEPAEPTTATVRVEADGDVTLELVGADKVPHTVGDVPSGRYTVVARFGSSSVTVGALEAKAGETIVYRCNVGLRRCNRER